MNPHFHDTVYYLKRAGYHAKHGALESYESIQHRLGTKPEPTRAEVVRHRVGQVRGRASAAVGTVRRSVGRRASVSSERNA